MSYFHKYHIVTDTGKNQRAKKLKENQEAWLKYRDTSLAFITEVNRNTGSTGNFIIEDYRVTLVKKRASELKYILSGPDAGPAEW